MTERLTPQQILEALSHLDEASDSIFQRRSESLEKIWNEILPLLSAGEFGPLPDGINLQRVKAQHIQSLLDPSSEAAIPFSGVDAVQRALRFATEKFSSEESRISSQAGKEFVSSAISAPESEPAPFEAPDVKMSKAGVPIGGLDAANAAIRARKKAAAEREAEMSAPEDVENLKTPRDSSGNVTLPTAARASINPKSGKPNPAVDIDRSRLETVGNRPGWKILFKAAENRDPKTGKINIIPGKYLVYVGQRHFKQSQEDETPISVNKVVDPKTGETKNVPIYEPRLMASANSFEPMDAGVQSQLQSRGMFHGSNGKPVVIFMRYRNKRADDESNYDVRIFKDGSAEAFKTTAGVGMQKLGGGTPLQCQKYAEQSSGSPNAEAPPDIDTSRAPSDQFGPASDPSGVDPGVEFSQIQEPEGGWDEYDPDDLNDISYDDEGNPIGYGDYWVSKTPEEIQALKINPLDIDPRMANDPRLSADQAQAIRSKRSPLVKTAVGSGEHIDSQSHWKPRPGMMGLKTVEDPKNPDKKERVIDTAIPPIGYDKDGNPVKPTGWEVAPIIAQRATQISQITPMLKDFVKKFGKYATIGMKNPQGQPEIKHSVKNAEGQLEELPIEVNLDEVDPRMKCGHCDHEATYHKTNEGPGSPLLSCKHPDCQKDKPLVQKDPNGPKSWKVSTCQHFVPTGKMTRGARLRAPLNPKRALEILDDLEELQSGHLGISAGDPPYSYEDLVNLKTKNPAAYEIAQGEMRAWKEKYEKEAADSKTIASELYKLRAFVDNIRYNLRKDRKNDGIERIKEMLFGDFMKNDPAANHPLVKSVMDAVIRDVVFGQRAAPDMDLTSKSSDPWVGHYTDPETGEEKTKNFKSNFKGYRAGAAWSSSRSSPASLKKRAEDLNLLMKSGVIKPGSKQYIFGMLLNSLSSISQGKINGLRKAYEDWYNTISVDDKEMSLDDALIPNEEAMTVLGQLVNDIRASAHSDKIAMDRRGNTIVHRGIDLPKKKGKGKRSVPSVFAKPVSPTKQSGKEDTDYTTYLKRQSNVSPGSAADAAKERSKEVQQAEFDAAQERAGRQSVFRGAPKIRGPEKPVPPVRRVPPQIKRDEEGNVDPNRFTPFSAPDEEEAIRKKIADYLSKLDDTLKENVDRKLIEAAEMSDGDKDPSWWDDL